MKKNIMKKILASSIAALAVALLPWQSSAQQPPATGVVGTLVSMWDVNNTNSLINAGEINLTPYFIWDGDASKPGGGLKAEWFVTQQQGLSLGYYEVAGRTAYWTVGYVTRTVFDTMRTEFSLGAGTMQDTEDEFGDVKLYIDPSITYGLVKNSRLDLRLTGGCYIVNGENPRPYIGATFRFSRW